MLIPLLKNYKNYLCELANSPGHWMKKNYGGSN